ncbi:hypothetical protein HOY82DRAFT_619514 [Tuber indicum]|nr:hypothetical protein HOY82DRAFT_619514 [Tuber indicum]
MSHKRIKHLISSGAFTEQSLPGGMPRGSSLYAEVSPLQDEWEQARVGYRTITTKINYDTLRDRRRDQMGLLPLIMEHEKAAQPFEIVSSDLGPTLIQDSRGVILGYRFRIPTHLIRSLNDSRDLLAPSPQKMRKRKPVAKLSTARNQMTRGQNVRFQTRHYAIWSDRNPGYKESVELIRDGEQGREWLLANKELFDHCTQQLRFLSPEQYVRMTGRVVKDMAKTKGVMGEPIRPLAGAWHGVAINEGLEEDESKGHLDWLDDQNLFNCVLPFGDGFSGGELILWPLKIKVELRIGDGFFFFGSLLGHQVDRVTSGVRHSLDLFTHKSNFDVLKLHDTRGGLQRRPPKEKTLRAEERRKKARGVPENMQARREIREGKKLRQRLAPSRT